MTQQLLRVKDVAKMLGVSKTSVWCWCSPNSNRYKANFPKPFKITPNVTAWKESEIIAYIDQLTAEQRQIA